MHFSRQTSRRPSLNPRTRAQISCNHCSQQLLARCRQTYRRHQADRTLMKPALQRPPTDGLSLGRCPVPPLSRWRFCPPLAHVLRSPAEVGAVYSTADARAAIKARVIAVNSTTDARAAVTAGIGATYSITGARAAITAGARDVLHHWSRRCKYSKS